MSAHHHATGGGPDDLLPLFGAAVPAASLWARPLHNCVCPLLSGDWGVVSCSFTGRDDDLDPWVSRPHLSDYETSEKDSVC